MTRQPKIERKTEYFPIVGGEVKATNDSQGIVEGYLNYIGNVDAGKDRTMPGAFTKSIGDSYARKSTQGLDFLWPYLWNHDYSILPPGGIFEANEDKKGLFIKTQFNLETQGGRDLYSAFKGGFMKKQSMGYKAYQHEYVKDKAGTVRNLLEVGVMEGSAVVFPMNDLAAVTGVKSLPGQKDFSDTLQHAMQHDWFEDLSMTWQALVSEIINAFMVGDSPVDDVQAALVPFNAALLSYVQKGVDLDITTFLNGTPGDATSDEDDDDGGYMSIATLAREMKAGRVISSSNHMQLSKACDGIQEHVSNIQKVLKTAQSSDAGKSLLIASPEEREQVDAAYAAQLEKLFMDVTLGNTLKNLRG